MRPRFVAGLLLLTRWHSQTVGLHGRHPHQGTARLPLLNNGRSSAAANMRLWRICLAGRGRAWPVTGVTVQWFV